MAEPKVTASGEEGSFATNPETNMQPEEKKAITCLIPPKGDKKTGHICFHYLAEVIRDKDKKKLPQKWLRNYELYRARHWRSKGSARLSTVNLIWNYVSRTVNLLTDNNPTFDIQAENDTVASKIHKGAKYWWSETEQQDVLANSIEISEICGCVIEKTIFNPSLNGGFGEVETISVDPHNFGFYPLNEKRPDKWEMAMHFYTMSVAQARRIWPDMAKHIISDKKWRSEIGEDRREVFGGSTTSLGAREYGDYGVTHATFTGNVSALTKIMGDESEVLILETWVKDYTMIDNVVLDPFTGEEVKAGKVPKYPGNIRCITSCNGGDVVLSDRPNPSINPTLPPELAAQTYLWDRFPFTLTPSNRDIVTPWGFSSVEQLESINFEVDKCLSQMNILKDKAVRSPIINPRNSGVENKEFTNEPAKVIRPKDATVAGAIMHMKPPPHHRDIETILTIYREIFDKISGQFDFSDPSIAKGRMAHKTVATIIESMHTMLRGKIRGYGKMIRERGRMWLSHAQNWYTEERLYFVEVEGGTTESGVLMGKDMIIPMHFMVVSGSTMPTSRLQQREEARELFGVGAIDIRELLERLDWPNKAEVIQRMEMGILGPYLQRMQALQVNPQIIQLVQKIASMDESEYNAIVNQMKEAQADQMKRVGNAAPVKAIGM